MYSVKVTFQRTILPEYGEWILLRLYFRLMDATRTLADVDDRGKLNKAEFHVAMGLIFRSMSVVVIDVVT